MFVFERRGTVSVENVCSVTRVGMLGLRSDCSFVPEVERNPLYMDVECERLCPGCV